MYIIFRRIFALSMLLLLLTVKLAIANSAIILNNYTTKDSIVASLVATSDVDSSLTEIFPHFSCGWRVSCALGDVTDYTIGSQLSTFADYRFSQFFGVNFSLNFLQSSFEEETIQYINVGLPSRIIKMSLDQNRSAFAVSGDCNIFFTPFANLETNGTKFRMGLGSSIRMSGMMKSSSSMNIITQNLEFSFNYTQQLSLGGNLSLEYTVPLSNIVDVGVHLQSFMFASPIYILGDKIPLSAFTPLPFFNTVQVASFGAFLRVSF